MSFQSQIDVKSPLMAAVAAAQQPSTTVVGGFTLMKLPPLKAKKTQEQKDAEKAKNKEDYAGKVKAADLAKELRKTIKAISQLDKLRRSLVNAERSRLSDKSQMVLLTVTDKKKGVSRTFTLDAVDQMMAKVMAVQKEVLKKMAYIGKRKPKPGGSMSLVYLGNQQDLQQVGSQVNPIVAYLQSDDFKDASGAWILQNLGVRSWEVVPRAMLQSLIQVGYLNNQSKLGWTDLKKQVELVNANAANPNFKLPPGHPATLAMQQAFGASLPSLFTYQPGLIEPVKAKVRRAVKDAKTGVVTHTFQEKDVYARQKNDQKVNTFQSLKVAEPGFDQTHLKPLVATSLIRVNSFPTKPDPTFPSLASFRQRLAASGQNLDQLLATYLPAAMANVKGLSKQLHDARDKSVPGLARAAEKKTKKPKKK
jgi:hypothetical protein